MVKLSRKLTSVATWLASREWIWRKWISRHLQPNNMLYFLARELSRSRKKQSKREVEVKSLLLIVHTKKSFWLLKHNNYCLCKLFVHWTWKLETMKALKLFGLFFIYLHLAKSFAEDLSSGHSFFAALDESQKVKLYWNVDTAKKEIFLQWKPKQLDGSALEFPQVRERCKELILLSAGWKMESHTSR